MYVLNISNTITLSEIALICPLVVTLTWSFPLIFKREAQDNSKRWLGILLFNMFILFLATNSFYFSSHKIFIFFDPFFMFSLLAIFPLLHFFVDGIVSPIKSFSLKKGLQFLPGFLFLLYSMVIYLFYLNDDAKNYYVNKYLSGENQLINELVVIERINLFNKIVFFVQAIFYFFVINKKINKHKEKISSYHSNLERLNFSWAKLFYMIYATSIAIGIPALIAGHESLSENKIFTILSMFLLSLIFYIIAWIGNTQNVEPEKLNFEIDIKDDCCFNKSDELKDKLISFFELKKPYLNPDLKIQDIYPELNTNRTYLSRLINKKFDTNFCMFVNKYRINEAKEIFSIPEYKKFKTEEIGKEVGFNSYQSFVQAFRLFEDTTPSKYRKKNCLAQLK